MLLILYTCAGHFPTWESAVGGFAGAKDFRQLRKSIAADPSTPKPPKPVGPRPRRIPPGEFDFYGQGHALPFPGAPKTGFHYCVFCCPKEQNVKVLPRLTV